MRLSQICTVLAAVPILGGCASMWNIGAAESSCPGVQSGVVCKTPIEVYRLTNNRDSLVTINADGQKAEAPGGSQGASTPGKASRANGMSVQLPQPLHQPQPILEPAQVMRIRVSPWIDQNGDLHFPSLLFTEVTPRRWAVGNLVTGASGRVPTAYQVEGAEGEVDKPRHSSAVPNLNSTQGGTIPMAPAGIAPYQKRTTGIANNAGGAKGALSGALDKGMQNLDKMGIPNLSTPLP